MQPDPPVPPAQLAQHPQHPPQKPRRRLRKRWALGPLVLLIALYLVHHLVAEVGWADLWERTRTARPGPLAFAALCLAGHLGLWGFRWQLAIRRVDATPRRRVIYSALAAAAIVNLTAPFARILGGLLRARYLARSGKLSVAAFYGVVLFDQAAHMIIMSSITLCAVVAGTALAGRTGIAVSLGTTFALAMAAFLFWEERLTARGPAALARYLQERATRRRGLAERLLSRGHETLDMFARLLADRALRYESALVGLGVFLMTALAQGAVFWALGLHPGPLVVLVTIALSTAAGTIAGTPGGLGATEAAMIALYVALDMHRLDAAAAALLYRAIFYLVIFATGLPSAAFLEITLFRGRRRSKRGAPGDPHS